MSPFIRGWKLDAIGGDTPEVAAILLRWMVTQPVVDRVIVSMRKPAWCRQTSKLWRVGRSRRRRSDGSPPGSRVTAKRVAEEAA